MATKGKRPMRALTPGDKIEAIQRVNDGESKASVARDIGVPESTLRGWCKNEDKLRYMSSRLSSPDTDRSMDGEPLDKRARTASPASPVPPSSTAAAPPAAPNSAPAAGLDLSSSAPVVEPRPEPPRQRPDPGASVSMSAISPLSGLASLPSLTHSHLGLSFNEIATNLTLLAQLNPGLAGFSAQSPSRALRSVRSPKPAHTNGSHEGKHRSKHHADPYMAAGLAKPGAGAGQQVDDALWYWLKTQQAMLDLTAQTTHPLHLKPEPAAPPKTVAPAPPVTSHLDYNRNSWLWQYYKQFGGAMPPPEDKLKSASQVPKDRTAAAENILYSHLTKTKEEAAPPPPPSPVRTPPQPQPPPPEEPPRAAESERRPSTEPSPQPESKEPAAGDKPGESRSQSKARTVLDSLLFSGAAEGVAGAAAAPGAAEALQHGERFLAWLEGSGDPSVTRVHVHQLRALLHNLRARRLPAAARK